MTPLTIVVPCHNEARRLRIDALHEFARWHAAVRFVLVDDGSTDDTRALLRDCVRRAPDRFDLIALDSNAGQGEAVRRGMQHAFRRGAVYAGFWDADLATPLREIPRFVAALDEHPRVEMVFGSRVKLLGARIERRPHRHYLGRLFAETASWVLQLPLHDTQCGAKVFRCSSTVRALFGAPFISRWVFDVELVARLIETESRAGRRSVDELIFELPLEQWSDVPGSKVGLGAFCKAPFELLRIRHRHLRGFAPRA